MPLPYSNETLTSPDGIECRVLEASRVNFDNAARGRKSTETLVRCAEGGEDITTRNTEGKIENTYIAKKGDAIFINLHNHNDIYVPGNPDGSRWQFSELAAKGYVITGEDMENGGVRVKNGATFKILPEAIESPSCIKDAWGAGHHQYLYPGATLKLNDNGLVTGIDKSAFDATWEITTPAKTALPAPAAPKPPKP